MRRRSNPTITVASKKTSVARVMMIVGLISSVLRMVQVCDAGSHTERSYRPISPRESKAVEIGYSPARHLI